MTQREIDRLGFVPQSTCNCEVDENGDPFWYWNGGLWVTTNGLLAAQESLDGYADTCAVCRAELGAFPDANGKWQPHVRRAGFFLDVAIDEARELANIQGHIQRPETHLRHAAELPQTRTLTVGVPGRPVPKVRMTHRSKHADPRARECLAYQQRVRMLAAVAAQQAGLTRRGIGRRESVFTGPVRVDWTAYISRQRGIPDKDNIEKSILDALQPEIVRVDNVARVPQGSSDVVYGVPEREQRVEIVVTELSDAAAEYMRQMIGEALAHIANGCCSTDCGSPGSGNGMPPRGGVECDDTE